MRKDELETQVVMLELENHLLKNLIKVLDAKLSQQNVIPMLTTNTTTGTVSANVWSMMPKTT